MRNRGQTETLGFVLVFAIITASIGIVYASGFAGLNEAREFEQVNNAERAFEVFADNIEDISHRNAPSRSTEIKLAGAELRIAEPIEMEVNDPDGGFNASYELRPVIYDPDTDTEIVYAQGAVIRTQGEAGVVVKEGTFIIGENRTIIPILQTRLVGNGGVSGSRTVLIRADQSQTRLIHANDAGADPFWLNVTSPRANIWEEHLSSNYPAANCSISGDTVSCSIETDRLYLVLVQIDLAIE